MSRITVNPNKLKPTAEACAQATQARLDSHAQSWGYDSMLSLVSYAGSAVPRFAAEASAGISLRDATWAAAATIAAEVEAGTRVAPNSISSYLGLLPDLPVRPIV